MGEPSFHQPHEFESKAAVGEVVLLDSKAKMLIPPELESGWNHSITTIG